MKRLVLVTVLWAVLLAMTAFAQNVALPRLAVVEFNANISNEKTKADTVTVRNLVESQMISTGKYQIITRDEIDKLLVNQQIQVSSISSAENIKKLQLQNVSYIVTGSVDAMDASYAITVKILDVSTGRFSHSADAFMGGDASALYTGIRSLVSAFAAGIGSSEGQVVQNTQAGTSGKYKVGDTGPGGGTVFYVEGNSGLEVSQLLGIYSWSEAKTAAWNYKGRGHSDWYLPTRSELYLIYENLQKAGVMNLGSNTYWSSSERTGYGSWYQRFSDGSQDYYDKTGTFSVRAVRAF